jgi:gluconolactonase
MEPELLWTGGEWLEGPLWMPELRRVRFSDIPNDRILEVDPVTGTMTVHRENVEFTNGRTADREGRVLQCSHGRRAIEWEIANVPETIVDRWAGGRFNSPNDIVVASDGAIWFTDPPYGLHESGREGHPGEPEYGGCFVFRFMGGVAEPVITDMVHPNGLAFSPDESKLYVADSAVFWVPGGPHHLKVYDVATGRGDVFAEIDPGVPDGLRVDPSGNVWTSAGRQVRVYSPDGELLETVEFPETVSNLCWGDGRWYVTASKSLYALTPVAG